jgi:hypothetical protein
VVDSSVESEGNRVASLDSNGLSVGSRGADIASQVVRVKVCTPLLSVSTQNMVFIGNFEDIPVTGEL